MPATHEKANTQILLDEIVAKLRHFVKLYAVESLFIAGGYCRALYLNRPWEVNDVDVASSFHEQALQLGGLFASEVLNTTPKFYHRTGTAMIQYTSELGTMKVEFQGDSINAYMHNQEVKDWMQKQGIENVPLMNNIYGRDFTINSMIYSLHNGQLYDPTGLAQRDFDRKVISSLLPPQMLIRYNPLAALRAIRFALTYRFHIAEELSYAMKASLESLTAAISMDRIMKDVVKILHVDGPKGLKMLKKYKLDRILLHPDIREHISLEGIEK